MSGLDQQTIKWLHSLKLSREMKSIRDFDNGYYFGQILSKMGLAAKQTFHNKNDVSCIFQNYKEVRDVLNQKLDINLPTDNLIGKAHQILILLQQCSSSLLSSKYGTGSINKVGSQTINAKRTSGSYTTQSLPRKIVVIEQKLQKFRDQHLKQQQTLKQQRSKSIALKQLEVQQRIREGRQKIKFANTFGKQQDKRIMQFWTKTQQVKLDRIQKINKLQDFLRCKKQNQLKLERQALKKGFQQSLQGFDDTCLRLGIDVELDPDRVNKGNTKQFNKVIFIQKIADKTAKQDLARKDKVKRLNNLHMMQKTTAAKAEKIYQQQNVVDKYAQMSNTQTAKSKLLNTQLRRTQHQNAKIIESVQISKKKQINIVFDEQKQRIRQDQYRQKKIQYMQINLARKSIKQERHQSQVQDIINKLINMTCEIYDQQRNTQIEEIPNNLWKDLSLKFIENIPGRLDKNSSIISKDLSKSFQQSKFNKAVVQNELIEYINMDGSWYSFNDTSLGMLNNTLSQEVVQLIDLVYPPISVQPTQQLSSYMPLKLSMFGSTLSGRHTQAFKLSQKYGLNIIDLNQIIKQALILANPPVQQKKGTKKDPKKGQQQKPQKIRLRQFGVKLKQKIKSADEADTQTLLEVFRFKIKQLFPKKTQQQINQQFKQAEQKAIQKHAQAVKEYQDALKKQKKDPKKPITPNQVDNTPKINPNPYTKGFIIVGFPDSLEKVIQFQKSVSGYITPNQRVNQKATQNRQTAAQIVFIQDRKPITILQQSYLDHIISLNVDKQKLQQRNQGRKLDPNTGISYHTKLNPCIPQVKGMIDQPPTQIIFKNQQQLQIQKYYQQRGFEQPKINLFKKINGNEIVSQVLKLVQQLILPVLNYKTSLFRKKIYGETIQQKPLLNPPSEPLIQPAPQSEVVSSKVQQTNVQQLKQQQLHEVIQSPVQEVVELKLSEAVANLLLKRFNIVCGNYSNDISSSLYKLQELRSIFIDSFYNVQGDILTTLLSPDDKNIKILSFQDSYNKLLSQKQGLVQIQHAKSHLLQKLDKLYDGLWDSIRIKKDEAVQKRKSFMTSTWLQDHSQQLLQATQLIMQIQLNKATQLIQFAISLKLSQQGRDVLQSNQHINYQCILDNNLIPVFNNEDYNDFPQLNRMIEVFQNLISSVSSWFQNIVNKNQITLSEIDPNNRLQKLLNESVSRLQLVSNHLNNHLSSRLRQYRTYFQLLLNRMDDWIIFGIKKENDTAYGHIKQIKKAINQAKKSNVNQSNSKQINQIYRPYDSISDTNILMPTLDGDISSQQLKIIVQQLRSITDEQGKISLDMFKQYIGRRIKSNLFPEALRGTSLDSIHQYLVQEDNIYFQQIALSFILLGYNIPSQQQIQKIYNDSGVNEDQQYISFSKFFQLKSFIDSEDYKRIIFVKYMLSDVFGGLGKSINIHAFCATLTTLNRIGSQSFSQIILETR